MKRNLFRSLMLLICLLTYQMALAQQTAATSNTFWNQKRDGVYYEITGDLIARQVKVVKMPAGAQDGDYEGEITIPQTIEIKYNSGSTRQYKVVSVDNGIFRGNKKITKLSVAEGISFEVKEHEFDGCTQLSELNLNHNVHAIGEYAFNQCICLRNLFIPNSVSSITDNYVFGGCKFQRLEIERGNSNLCLRTGGYGYKNYNNDESWQCDSIIIGREVSTYSNFFQDRKIRYVAINSTIPNGLFCNSYSRDHFTITELQEVYCEDGCTSIGNNAFKDCSSLRKIVLPTKMSSIGSEAFMNCTNITEVSIPTGIPQIADATFSDCI